MSWIHPQNGIVAAKENISDSRIAVSCSNCTYEFILPLPDLLMSKSTPQNDTEAIQSFISEATEGEVTRCSDEILRLRGVIELVKKHQSKLSHEISIHQSFISPIHRLPPELLALIFSFFCIVDFQDWTPYQSKEHLVGSVFREPFIVATVCSQWRSIAVSTPSLWSTIMLKGSDDMGITREEYEADEDLEGDLDESRIFPDEVLEVALQRSAQHPLRLWADRYNDLCWPLSFTSQLRQVCSRIQHLYVGGDLDPFHVPNSPHLVLNQLSAVSIIPNEPYNQPRGIMGLPWLSTAAEVQFLLLENLGEADAGFWDQLPFHSTRFLFIHTDACNIPEAVSAFSKFPNLASSVLMCEHFDFTFGLPIDPTVSS
ncbi:hypothetical protein C8J56DRAFT_92691 [Mycena floridula]|nr:hypothetical protein C8J56DRAFT_92691 [Mycena floridula]